MIIFERKIYKKLLAWKEQSKGTRALLIEGARRVGKSTIAKHFAENEYKSYLMLDFANVSPRVKKIFEEQLTDLDSFFMLLQTETGVMLYHRESLLVFDEIQRFPRAREAIKTLVADGRYDYLETGSLISIRENVKDILIPSEERRISMYPMDFEEFCMALGNTVLPEYIRNCFDKKMSLDEGIHRKAMFLFKQYMIVGGMPQSVSAFLEEKKSFLAADAVKRDILNLYRDDIMKIESRYRAKVLSIFDQIPAFLSRHEKRVVLSEIADNSTFARYEDTFFWLSNSMIANECFNCLDPNVGLMLNEDRTYVKCYMGDTGLLISHTFSENELVEEELYKKLLGDRLSVNRGMFFENAVAQELVAHGHRLFFYTHYSREKHRNDMEIDFLLSNGSKLNFKLTPIEVKSSKNYQTKSLAAFKEKYHERIAQAVVIHPKNLKEEDGILFIPVYMTMCL
ncbi:MAG: AAA family ATPase [Clostridiales bacterium]|nr:AAA family ATPase [Clostridiales bacterium]